MGLYIEGVTTGQLWVVWSLCIPFIATAPHQPLLLALERISRNYSRHSKFVLVKFFVLHQ